MTFLKKILLVDYEPRVTALVRTALESTGQYVIKEETDSRRAVNAARWFQPDLILLDVIMSRPDGNAVALELQADASLKDTPVVFLSANAAPEGGVVSGGILSGYSFFANPVCIDEFVRCVAELVNPTVSTPKKIRTAPDALAP